MTTTERTIMERERFKYVEDGGRQYLVMKTKRGDWGKRRINAEPQGNRLPNALRKQIIKYYETPDRSDGVLPPPGWRLEHSSWRIVPYDPDKIVARDITPVKARNLGFSTKKDMINFIANQTKNGKSITSYTALRAEKARRDTRRRINLERKKDKKAKKQHTRQMDFVLREMRESRAAKLARAKQQALASLRLVSRRHSPTTKIGTSTYNVNLEMDVSNDNLPDVTQIMSYILEETIQESGLRHNDHVQLILESPDLTRGAVVGAFSTVSNMRWSIDSCLERLTKRLNSAESLSGCSVSVRSITKPQGQGNSRKFISVEEKKRSKSGIFPVRSEGLCGPISLILCHPFSSIFHTPYDAFKSDPKRDTLRHKIGGKLAAMFDITLTGWIGSRHVLLPLILVCVFTSTMERLSNTIIHLTLTKCLTMTTTTAIYTRKRTTLMRYIDLRYGLRRTTYATGAKRVLTTLTAVRMTQPKAPPNKRQRRRRHTAVGAVRS